MTRPEATLDQFRKATDRLREALGLEKSPIVRDSAILRFEIAMDLLEGIEGAPRKQAWRRVSFSQGMLSRGVQAAAHSVR